MVDDEPLFSQNKVTAPGRAAMAPITLWWGWNTAANIQVTATSTPSYFLHLQTPTIFFSAY